MNSAVLLIEPKYPRNVGSVIRACSIFDVKWLRWTGPRVDYTTAGGQRLPREERFKDYAGVDWKGDEYALDEMLDAGLTPIAIEKSASSEGLPLFEHPSNAVYIFGPEDGSIPKEILSKAHRFVRIPSANRTPLNLAAAVNIVLYDRFVKSQAKEWI